MKTIELIGHVDNNHRFSLEVPPSIQPGPIKVLVEVENADENAIPTSWAQAIAQAWADDWSDPSEDIYTHEDGKPVDESW